jgi:hypothetical protein
MSGMINNSTMLSGSDSQTNFILISVGALFALLALIIIYYVIIGYGRRVTPMSTRGVVNNGRASSAAANNRSSSAGGGGDGDAMGKYDGLPPSQIPTNTPPSGMIATGTEGTKQVFNVSDNLFTYDDGEAVCRAYGSELATYEQVVDAYKKGANWCNYGWTKGQLALYPTQTSYWQKYQDSDPEEAESCGMPGINGGYFENKNLQFGVNCYGVKRIPNGSEQMKSAYVSDKEREIREKVNVFKRQLKNWKLTPFNEDKWSSCA